MRTTLDLDDNLLAIAKVRAREKGISLGAAVSEMMRQGLRVPRATSLSGFPVFDPPADAPMVTDDVVERHRDDDPSLD
ncbi:MAG: antitoxin [Dermatophilaceae bacterium]